MNVKRLLKLVNHLKKGRLGHKIFNFAVYNEARPCLEEAFSKKEDCRALGCALGECPIVFPAHWKFSDDDVVLRGKKDIKGLDAAADFFDISPDEAFALFVPREQDRLGLPVLYEKATRKQVAKNIELFIARR